MIASAAGGLPHTLPDSARLRGLGGNHLGRLSRRIGQVLVEKGCSKWFDSRRLHHYFAALRQETLGAATSSRVVTFGATIFAASADVASLAKFAADTDDDLGSRR